MKKRLKELLAEVIDPNPRAEKLEVLARISLDGCVNEFRSAASSVLSHTAAPVASDAARRSAGTLPEGPEQRISIGDPPIAGRLDWIRSGVICDFKTGEPDEAHAAQLRTYALLFWIAFGELPKGLEIYYVRMGEHIAVPVPSEAEMVILRQGLKQEIDAANRAITSGEVRAHPSEETCGWCPVRQLCDDYWSHPATETLRWIPGSWGSDQAQEGGRYSDVEVERVASHTTVQGYHGVAYVSGDLGQVILSLPAAATPGPGVRPRKIRLLNARIDNSGEHTSISALKHTEVFWLL